VKAAAHDMHDGTNDIIALEADEAFMARLSTPRGSNSVAQSETRRTGLAQMFDPDAFGDAPADRAENLPRKSRGTCGPLRFGLLRARNRAREIAGKLWRSG
jgi:hypothetical protein